VTVLSHRVRRRAAVLPPGRRWLVKAHAGCAVWIRAAASVRARV